MGTDSNRMVTLARSFAKCSKSSVWPLMAGAMRRRPSSECLSPSCSKLEDADHQRQVLAPAVAMDVTIRALHNRRGVGHTTATLSHQLDVASPTQQTELLSRLTLVQSRATTALLIGEGQQMHLRQCKYDWFLTRTVLQIWQQTTLSGRMEVAGTLRKLCWCVKIRRHLN